MQSVRGTIKNGVVHPNEPIQGHDGESVTIVLANSVGETTPEPKK